MLLTVMDVIAREFNFEISANGYYEDHKVHNLK